MRTISDRAEPPALGSTQWIAGAQRALAELHVTDAARVRIKNVIDDEQPALWWFDIANGEVRVGANAEVDEGAEDEPPRTVTFTMNRAVAEAVRAGQLRARDAVGSGAISIAGDAGALIGANEALRAISRALADQQND